MIGRSALLTNPFILSLFLALLAGTLALFPISSYDTWWILAVGERMLETREILRTGVGSWTRASTPYASLCWILAILTTLSHSIAGERGLFLLRS